jgi:hypothetical protein
LSDAENLNLSLQFKTLIVLTLRYQRAPFRRAPQSFCAPPPQKLMAIAASLPKSRRRLYRRPAGRISSRPEEAGEWGRWRLLAGNGVQRFCAGSM